ncbi:MAG: hypothetical protein RLZ10_575 [Bacteroidota bacterium]|jgi:hypothetical protein
MFRKISNSRINLTLLLFVLLSFASCVKIKPTVAVIYIKNPNGSMCEGAQVRLYGQPATVSSDNVGQELRIDLTTVTDVEGRAYFDLTEYYKAGQTGMAILNVDAMKYNQVSSGFIQVLEQETNEETFFLQ